jgi:protein-histidine pros-kinase
MDNPSRRREPLIDYVHAERYFRLILNTAPDAMIVSNRAGKIILANVQTESVFGYARDELLGRKIEVLMPRRYRREHLRHLQEMLEW